jgi:MFS family permease
MNREEERKEKINGIKAEVSENKNNHSNFQVKSRSPHFAWKMLVILSCIASMVMYAETMLIPAIPTLINDFNVSYGLSSWLLTSYLIAGAVMTPIAGKLSDIYGRKKILLVIMLIYTAGVSIGGFVNDIHTMIFARAIQGIGMSMFPIAFGIIRDQFPREKISMAQGAITSMFAAGSVIGLSVGGIIIEHFGWRMTFFTIIPISLIILFTIRKYVNVPPDDNDYGDEKNGYQSESQSQSQFKVNYSEEKREVSLLRNDSEFNSNNNNNKKETNKPKIQIDIKGSITLATTITAFLLALTLIQTPSADLDATVHNSPIANTTLNTILPFIAVGTISLSLFIYIEKHAQSPLIDFKIFMRPPILLSSLIIMIVGASMFMIFQTIPIIVQTPEPIGFGQNAIDTGRVQLPFAIVLLFFGPTSGFIISKLGASKPIVFGSMLSSLGFIVLLMFHSSELFISASLGILSAGLSLAAVGAMNMIILSTPKEYAGVTIGMSSLLRIIGGSIGPALAAMYMQTNQSPIAVQGVMASLPSSASFDMIFLTAVMLSVASLMLAIILRKKIKEMEETASRI